MTFYGILEAFFQFSFETVLIRDQERSRESYNTAWTLNIIKGATVAALLVLGAKPIAVLFNEPQVEAILYFIAAVPALRWRRMHTRFTETLIDELDRRGIYNPAVSCKP